MVVVVIIQTRNGDQALREPPLDTKALDDYGLMDDCEVFENMFEYCCAVAGASLHASNLLVRGEADVAINWGGGRWVSKTWQKHEGRWGKVAHPGQ